MKTIQFILLIFLSKQILLAQKTDDILIKDANIISMLNDKIISKKSVLISGGKIKQIDDFNKIKKNKALKIIDASGKYLMPGLADMHVHLPAESKIDTMLITNLAAGITHIRVMNNDVPQLKVKAKIETRKNYPAPNMHFSYIITKDINYTSKQYDSLMLEIKRTDLSFIKLISIADEKTFDLLMTSANKHKIIVCGHYPSSVSIEKLLKSKFRSIEHLGGYDKTKDADKLLAAIQLTKEQGTYNCPTLDYDVMAAYQNYPNDYKTRVTLQLAPKKTLENWETEYLKSIEENGGKEKTIGVTTFEWT